MPPLAGLFTHPLNPSTSALQSYGTGHQPLHPSTLPPDSLRQKSLNNRSYPSPYPPNSNYARPPQPGPSEPMVPASIDESKKDKRRREMTDRVARFADSRRDERVFVDQQNALRANAHQLYTSPNTHPEFSLRLYPITLERTANLNRIEAAEQAGIARAEAAYEEEQDKIEDEWRRQKDRLRERMLEAIEERRRKAREEKDGEGAGESILDPQSRPHATRNSRHGQGISTPTLSEPNPSAGILSALGAVPGFTTAGMALYPWALSGPPVPEDLSSPFPLALTSLAPPNAYTVNTKGKRVKDTKTVGNMDVSVSKALTPARTGWTGGWGTGTTSQSNGGGPDVGAACVKLMGRSPMMLAPAKDQEIEADLNEIRRGVKRRRTLAPTAAAANR
ncbi:centrosomal protein ATPase [Rhizoctonia solani AG-1 IB]|uniref:Centrosomal protein ATPase n=3 Tax=Rhizoctonia solani TaxID=456999 RepID=A0A8H2WQX0_9AGAM|nr:unnamed protein product [Rhizoctonia solani]CEL61912.1 centrosomal protein ATPase [Rhizoctonia solani AG-1 IB]